MMLNNFVFLLYIAFCFGECVVPLTIIFFHGLHCFQSPNSTATAFCRGAFINLPGYPISVTQHYFNHEF